MESFADVKYILDGFLFIFSGILVMWMAAGFAMLEAGLTRAKNNATILTKNMALFAISCIMFYWSPCILKKKEEREKNIPVIIFG